MDLKRAFGVITASVLFFFGIVFAIASVYVFSRLIVAVMFFVVGFVMVYYVMKKPKTIIQRVEFSGELKTVALKCPNCSAPVDAEKIKVMSGVPYATCQHCGQTFEVIEEPKW